MAVQINNPTYLVQIGVNGQLTVFEVLAGNLADLTMNQLFTAQRDIAGATELVKALIVRNLT